MKFYFLLSLVLLGFIIQAQTPNHNFCAALKHAANANSPQLIADTDENKYDVKYHKLDIAMTYNSAQVTGTVTTIAQVVQAPFNRFVCELKSMQVSSVKINGQSVTFTNNNTTIAADLTTPLNVGDIFTVEITYGGLAQEGVILNTSQLYGFTVAATLSEPYEADGWWPCKQVLTDKIDSCDVWITVPSGLKAGSNGVLQNITNMPNNKKRYEWKSRHPIDYYLISSSVADYQEYNVYAHPANYPDSILIQNYIYNSVQALNNNKDILDSTALLLEYFSDILGLYPFADEKYGHCQAPIGGGMEHQTMTTISRFDFYIVAHELGHQWFGDNVTCASWEHIWVNEGFASYTEYLAFEHFRPQYARPYMDDVHSIIIPDYADFGTVFCDDTTNEGRIFDADLSYAKGGAIIHSLRFEVNNDSLFFAALRTFQQQNANGTAIAETVKDVFETVANRDFTDFFNQWYYGVGYPEFDVEWGQGNGQTMLIVSETASAPNTTPFFTTPLEIKLSSAQGDTTIRVDITQPLDTFILNWQKPVTAITVDPNQWILNTVGSVSFNQTLDVIEEQQNTVALFPNPADDFFTISSPKSISVVKLHNMSGKLISSYNTANQTNYKVDVSLLPAGIYVAEIESATGIKSHKLFTKQ